MNPHLLRTTITVLLTMAVTFVYAQNNNNGSLKGTVLTSDHQPAAAVTVQLKAAKKYAITDEKGNFQINRIPAGTHELTVSLTGYETLQQTVTIQSGNVATVNLELTVSHNQLNEVIVTGAKSRFVKTQSLDVAKMPLKDIENPQVYSTITAALMEDQLNVRYSDALKNVPGVVMQLENGGPGGTVTSRGFSTSSYLRNGVPGTIANGTIDPANIESIEAIKGPSGTLYGSSLISFGGLFNRITKKPFETGKGNIGYTGGGYGLNRLTADLNTPLNKEHTLLLRTNAAIYHEGNFQDAGFKTYAFIAPSLTYKISDRTELNIDLEYKKERANSFYRMFADGSYATGVRSPEDLKIDFKKRFTGNDLYLNFTNANIFATLKHRFSEHWTSQTQFTYLYANTNGGWAYLSMLAGNDSLIRYVSYTDYSDATNMDIQQNFNGDFKIGSMRNRLLIGVDAQSVTTSTGAPGVFAFDQLGVAKPGTAYTSLTRMAVLDRVKSMTFNRTRVLQNTYASYVQDALNITDRLLVMAAVRVDYFDSKGTVNYNRDTTTGAYHQTAVSTKFGANYQLLKDKLSVFGNYMSGFQNNAPVVQPNGNTSVFKPSKANQWEVGVKAGSADGKLSGSVSYYNINVSDVIRADAPDNPTYTVQNGTQYSKGVEAEITATPFDNFLVVAGYAYNDSKLEKSSPALDGFRPGSAGPAHLANLWLSYRLPQGELKGLGLGVGGNYSGENIVNVSTTGYYALPAYTILNATLSYDQPHYRLTARVDNITNKDYWVGWSTTIPQMPLRVSVGGEIKF